MPELGDLKRFVVWFLVFCSRRDPCVLSDHASFDYLSFMPSSLSPFPLSSSFSDVASTPQCKRPPVLIRVPLPRRHPQSGRFWPCKTKRRHHHWDPPRHLTKLAGCGGNMCLHGT
jgi:hypothetical protein